jgi:hypothetical protein
MGTNQRLHAYIPERVLLAIHLWGTVANPEAVNYYDIAAREHKMRYASSWHGAPTQRPHADPASLPFHTRVAIQQRVPSQ